MRRYRGLRSRRGRYGRRCSRHSSALGCSRKDPCSPQQVSPHEENYNQALDHEQTTRNAHECDPCIQGGPGTASKGKRCKGMEKAAAGFAIFRRSRRQNANLPVEEEDDEEPL